MTALLRPASRRSPTTSVNSCGFRSISTVFPKSFPTALIVALRPNRPAFTIPYPTHMTKRKRYAGQIVLFPGAPGETNGAPGALTASPFPSRAATAPELQSPLSAVKIGEYQVVLSGSYRKDFEALKATYETLRDLGCVVLSPSNVTAVRETDGFVYMKGEEAQAPDAIEARHLDAIQKANFVWLHAPDGYVGPTASLEIGFARAVGVPIFAREEVKDSVIRSFVEQAASPAAAIETMKTRGLPPPQPALAAFQHYYRRVAIQRGYKSESPKDCLLLMVEEVGELAREIRRRDRLVRHGPTSQSDESKELADIFLYVVHMANVLDVDLSKVVQEKELINLQRFLRR
jgi:NTP pyrophosphatase (non-canonical NTP hydrolase)